MAVWPGCCVCFPFGRWEVNESHWQTTDMRLWGSKWSVGGHPLAFVHHRRGASSSSPTFVNSVCVYANTIRKRGSPSLPSQREQGAQPLVIHTDEPPLIEQNVISDYIIFELLQLSLMSTIHQRWALLNGVWLPRLNLVNLGYLNQHRMHFRQQLKALVTSEKTLPSTKVWIACDRDPFPKRNLIIKWPGKLEGRVIGWY